jgi:hypothetical protein
MMDRKLPPAPKKITPAFGFSYIKERALREGLGKRRFGLSEMASVVKWFEQYEPQPCCAFCRNSNVQRWDHLIPVRNDGETVLGNMVLACQPCDDSKGGTPFIEWMSGSAPKSPGNWGVADVEERIQRLKAYMEAFHYSPIPLEERLNESERVALSRVRSKLDRLKREVNSLIDGYKKRTNSA